jgi:hypothetical protein
MVMEAATITVGVGRSGELTLPGGSRVLLPEWTEPGDTAIHVTVGTAYGRGLPNEAITGVGPAITVSFDQPKAKSPGFWPRLFPVRRAQAASPVEVEVTLATPTRGRPGGLDGSI